MAAAQFKQLQAYLDSQVVGQQTLTQNILVALLADGHLLVEGPPGLAKTRAVNALAIFIAYSLPQTYSPQI